MSVRGLKRAVALIMAAALLLAQMTACGNGGKKKPAVTIRIMSWNEDFRDMMERYFIPGHRSLMENVEIEWITTEINGYLDDLQARLSEGEKIDVFLGSCEMAPFIAADPNVAALSSLGIGEEELASQYRFTRVLGSDGSGVQKGSAINAEPGIIVYRADYAEQYLGITHQAEMQERLSSWESLAGVASELSESSGGSVKMFAGSAELWKSVEWSMAGLWMTDGRLTVSDETLGNWLDIVHDINDAKGFAGFRPFDDEWYGTVSDGVFCFYAAPWLCKATPAGTAGITTIFSAAKSGGASFGKFRTSLAPGDFVYGGNWLYSPVNCEHREIAAEIIRSFTCDRDFMKHLALAEMQYVNNTEVCRDLAGMKLPNPMFDGLDAFSVYDEAARGLEMETPTVYDASLSELLYDQARQYARGKIKKDEAIYKFRQNVRKRHGEIAD